MQEGLRRRGSSYSRSEINILEYYTTVKLVIWNHPDKEVHSFKGIWVGSCGIN